ncbi:MAG: hypothetical protein A3F83_09765 [Candidatus Glassbacteria bacterium RIFCSPLOWO2_12_FULL_58_11]|uniref:Carbohydrate kinase FGGY C-terminal domain-containing protein n=1 Tax=Candidatus Glassbacteria bacterium RIFCSPLOWO2_12_FULL_58_11 TaxID=1817867 RepID=A0A1F5Z3K9_9BACT|nr:MAG: hypothetical protein A3F83_09765 [Candidatus Glassbacteria bacterium RIFCSPLOWO2_12_FULL_58_11]
METIIVPVDGASSIKLEVLDYETLTTRFSRVAPTPVAEADGLKYNATGEQFAWYESAIRELPGELRQARVIAPAARGASGGLIGKDNTLAEVPGRGLTLSYSQGYPARTAERFRELAGSAGEFFRRTGSIRDFPGSLTLLKRFLFEEMERPALLERAEYFGTYNVLIAGHFLGPDYREAARKAGNENSYWMCHTGARDINAAPGTPSPVSRKIAAFGRLVPSRPVPAYHPLGTVPERQAASLGLGSNVLVVPGGHDTCLSHLPIVSSFYRIFPEHSGRPVVHLEAGSWTMAAQVSGAVKLPEDGYKKAVLVQGTLDGEPVVTSMYGGGRDFSYLAGLLEQHGISSAWEFSEDRLDKILGTADCFVLPNINPENHGTGPFPGLKGKIINEDSFFRDSAGAMILANLCIAQTAAVQLETISPDRSLPVVLTAGGSKDPCFGRLVATLTGRNVYALFDRLGHPLSETTTLGAAIVGKAACLGVHPYAVDIKSLGLSCREIEPFKADTRDRLAAYREKFFKHLRKTEQTGESN